MNQLFDRISVNRIGGLLIIGSMFFLSASNSFSQTATPPAGTGTSGNPYLISTLDNLYWITQHGSSWSSYFLQTADIDASSDSTWNGGKGFSFIGTNTNTYFGGVYDGGGHVISGLYISVDSINWVGMFGFCVGAHIKNLGLAGERVTAGSGNNAGQYVGGFAGDFLSSSMDSCYTSGGVNGSQIVGGLVGYNSGSTINASFSTDSVNSANGNAGGLVGQNISSSTVTNCYAAGKVSSIGGNLGGIAGFNNSTIAYTFSASGIYGAGFNTGAFIGADISGSTVDSCFWNTDSTAAAGIGNGTPAGASGKTSIQLKDPATYTNAGYDTASWYMGDSVNSGYAYLKWQNPAGNHLVVAATPSGTGTVFNPYRISSLDNLYWLTQNSSAWSSYFSQTANIDASQSSGWNSGAGAQTIGNGTTAFTGSYDGGVHTISGLTISRGSTDYIGMFGIASGGTIRGLGLVNASISGGNDVGGIVGFNSSAVTACFVTGTVAGNTSDLYTGGLVGVNFDAALSTDYNNSTVTGGNIVGGLVGYNITSSTGASIDNSYSTGLVVGFTEHAGGLVGENDGATITNSYSTGEVIGSNSGGLVALSTDGASTSGSFWDTETSGWSSSAGGTGKTDLEMRTESTFTNASWDFSGTWSIDGGINMGYPYLTNVTEHSLAVQATDFVASTDVSSVTLSWKTESEVSNAGFEIERQNENAKGWEMIASYVTLKSLAGLGTSSTGKSYQFTDNHVTAGQSYDYKIMSVSTNGTATDLATLSVSVNAPKNYALYQNYPNPFNPTTSIRFDLKETSPVVIEIYNLLGQKVNELDYGTLNAGRYEESVNMNRFASGVYFYRLHAGSFTQIKKMVLIK